jgi:predicted nucleic acid-binding protein
MGKIVLADSGPIVAALDRRDRHHVWARAQFDALAEPCLTCESVLSECFFLLEHLHDGKATLCRFLERGLIDAGFHFGEHRTDVLHLIGRYASVPMSLADACLVRMSELHANATVLTTDKDFTIYRRNGRQMIPLRAPW